MRTFFLAAALVASSACSEQKSVENQLVGTWNLVSASARVAGEAPEAPYGQRPSGLLIYTPERRMMVQVSDEGRHPLSGDDPAGAPVEERARAFTTHFSYAGEYEVHGNRVVHNVEIASVPNWVGEKFPREFKLQGNRLTLSSPPTSYRGRPRTFSLTWERST